MTTPLKFKQLLFTTQGLWALAEDGSVWVYMGGIKGWKAITMEVYLEIPKQQPMYTKVPSGWNDDVPF